MKQSDTTVLMMRLTRFVGCGVCRHTPGTGLATFGNHDSKLVHGVGFEAGDGVAERRGVCGLDTTEEHLGVASQA